MSDLRDFLEDAKTEVDLSRYDRDVKEGRISEADAAHRNRVVGREASPLVVGVGFKTDQAWEAYYSGRSHNLTGPLPAPPELPDE